MKYNCVIIDEDYKSILNLQKLITLSANLQLINTYHDPFEAMGAMNKEQDIDILFMDIQFKEVSELQVVPVIQKMVKHIIIITEDSKYAVNAFELNVDQFLLKPFNKLKFFIALNYVIRILENKKDQVKLLYVKGAAKHSFSRVAIESIVAIEASKNKINIYTLSEILNGYHSMKEMAESLHKFPDFLKVHKSFIVNSSHICRVELNTLVMINKLVIPIGESHQEKLRTFVKERTFII